MQMKNALPLFILLLLSSCAFTKNAPEMSKQTPEMSKTKVRVNVTLATNPYMTTPLTRLTKEHLHVALRKFPHIEVHLIPTGEDYLIDVLLYELRDVYDGKNRFIMAYNMLERDMQKDQADRLLYRGLKVFAKSDLADVCSELIADFERRVVPEPIIVELMP